MMPQHSWNIVHKLEETERSRFLRRLTAQEGFRIFQDLYRIAYRANGENAMLTLNLGKIKALSKIHFAFNKLKI